ncbi:helix-turn-helix domain-containing protein [Flindersiella endophytica]
MATHQVSVAITEGMPIFEAAIPCEVFGRARSGLPDAWYDFKVCSSEPGQTHTDVGFAVSSPHGLDQLADADTVIVPACANLLHDLPSDLVAAVRAAYERGARIVSLCTGAFVLAEAGALDGRRATVHWMYADQLARRYPKVHVDPAVLYIDEGQVLTSAGTTAGLDLCLHLVRLDHGSEVANLLARRLVMPPHRGGGQAQFVDAPVPAAKDDSLGPLMEWAVAHLDHPITIADLARREHLTPRTFIRRFQAAIGTSPLRWLLAQRIQRARLLLESTDEPPSRVAQLSGLGGEANLRHHFARTVGVPPVEYRRAFRDQRSTSAGINSPS